MINIAGKYFYIDESEASKHRAVCERYITKLIQNAMTVVILIILSYGITTLNGLYSMVFVDPWNTFLGNELPFIDSKTHVGYGIVIIEQLIRSIVSMISTVTIEIGACIVYNAFTLMPDLIYLDAAELDTELNFNGMTYYAQMRLRNIVLKMQDYDG